MRAYRTYLTIGDPKRIVLTNLPFRRGERVEVLLLTRSTDRETVAPDLKALLKDTQSLPQVQTISEAEIATEVSAYRSGQ